MEEKTIWYWEYIVKVWDMDKEKEDSCAGVVAAYTMTEAMKLIEDYYDNELLEVHMLKAITDIVMDFDLVNADTDFDFRINRK